jgi:hypothetical protein
MKLTKLSDQLALREEWRATELKQRGALEAWERKLQAWDGQNPLDGGVWAQLLEWAKRTGRVSPST